jgi:hypothetical protein
MTLISTQDISVMEKTTIEAVLSEPPTQKIAFVFILFGLS